MTDTFARQRQLIGTTAEWAANDLIIGQGELALERLVAGAVRAKIGNGVDRFSVLPYFDPGIFQYVLRGGDTMTGPLVVPELTVDGAPAQIKDGMTVDGSAAFTGPVALGSGATVLEPGPTDNSQRVPSTHWVLGKVGGVVTGLHLLGTWNAATNTPPLNNGGAGSPPNVRGDFFLVSVAGTTTLDGISSWAVGDSVVFNGVTWQKVPQTLYAEQIALALGYTPADDAAVIKKTIVDAAGDVIIGTAADVVARLPVGTAGQVLGITAGLPAWQTPAAVNFISIKFSKYTTVGAGSSWTPDAKMIAGYAVAKGGGGGAYTLNIDPSLAEGGGGGGEGATATKFFKAGDYSGAQTVTVGAGGAPAAAGVASSISTWLIASAGGTPPQGLDGGPGGTTGTGDLVVPGAPGAGGMYMATGSTAYGISGAGGGAGGGRSVCIASLGGVVSGTSGQANSGGGGGGAASKSAGPATGGGPGGAGGSGYVYVVEYLKP